MKQQHDALEHLERRTAQQNTHALECSIEERDKHIKHLESLIKGKDEDLKKAEEASAAGKPVKMNQEQASKLGAAISALQSLSSPTKLKHAKTKTNVTMDAAETQAALDANEYDEEDAFAAMPGWSLNTWLSSLLLQNHISTAIQNHICAKAGRSLDSSMELKFMQQLGKVGNRDTVMAMLRETTLFDDLANALWEGVRQLTLDMEEEARIRSEMSPEQFPSFQRPDPEPEDEDGDDEDEDMTPEEMEAAEVERRQEFVSELEAQFERDLQVKEKRREQNKREREVTRSEVAKKAAEDIDALQTQMAALEESVESTREELEKAEKDEEPDDKIFELKGQLATVQRQAKEAKVAAVEAIEKEEQRMEEEKVKEKAAEKLDDAERVKDLAKKPTRWQLVRLDVRSRRAFSIKKKKTFKTDGKAYNETLKLDSNVRQLAYAPAKTFFQGMATVVGRCEAEPGEDEKLLSLMFGEHVRTPQRSLPHPVIDHCFESQFLLLQTKRKDSDSLFEPPNFLIPTTSRIEYWAVSDPTNGLRELGLDDWPKEQRGVDNGGRKLHPPEYFRPGWDAMNEKLAASGEPPLSRGGFVALRLYTGPLFFKYNNVLRGVSVGGMKAPLEALFNKLCQGNRYTNTMHAITAAISKLSRVTKCDLVYRAPGGALPPYFWDSDKMGIKGGIEMGFMSTSRSKEAAMHYAKMSGVKLIFEVQQGMVARGADVSWLSMYPKEDEVLFPPMCACEVQQTRVEGSVVVVELRPGVAAPALQEPSLEQLEEERQASKEKRESEARARREAIDRVAKSRARWMMSKSSLMASAERRMMASAELAAAKARKDAAKESDRALSLVAENMALQRELKARQELEEKIREEAEFAADKRVKALEAKELLHNAQHMAECMKRAALKHRLEEEQITLKSLREDKTAVMSRIKVALAGSKVDVAAAKVAEAELKLEEALEREAALQARFDESHVRTLHAEDKVQKLQKQLAENKKMLDALMK